MQIGFLFLKCENLFLSIFRKQKKSYRRETRMGFFSKAPPQWPSVPPNSCNGKESQSPATK